MPKIGERKRMKCKGTKKFAEMEYTGEIDPSNPNGHPGWLCLHDEVE